MHSKLHFLGYRLTFYLLPPFKVGFNLHSLVYLCSYDTSKSVLSSTGHENNTAHVTVDLVNPFSADLHITQITSSVKSHGINLGSINQGVEFAAGGKKTSTSPALNLDMNLDPASIFSVTRALAVLAGLDTEQLDGIVQLGGYQYLQTTDDDSRNSTTKLKRKEAPDNGSFNKRDNIYTNFNLPNFIDTAFKQLRADVQLTSSVTIGELIDV